MVSTWPFEGLTVPPFLWGKAKVNLLSTTIKEDFQLTKIPDKEIDGLLSP